MHWKDGNLKWDLTVENDTIILKTKGTPQLPLHYPLPSEVDSAKFLLNFGYSLDDLSKETASIKVRLATTTKDLGYLSFLSEMRNSVLENELKSTNNGEENISKTYIFEFLSNFKLDFSAVIYLLQLERNSGTNLEKEELIMASYFRSKTILMTHLLHELNKLDQQLNY